MARHLPATVIMEDLMEVPNSRAEAAHTGFRLARTQDGSLRLRSSGSTALPVNEAYLEHMLAVRQLALAPGDERAIDADWAREALAEALDETDHAIRSVEALKRLLLIHLRRAESAPAPPAPSEAA